MNRRELRRARMQVAMVIAKELGEVKENGYPIHSVCTEICALLYRVPVKTCVDLVYKAREIHAGEGMWLESQQRFRTVGGVWFQLARAENDRLKAAAHAS